MFLFWPLFFPFFSFSLWPFFIVHFILQALLCPALFNCQFNSSLNSRHDFLSFPACSPSLSPLAPFQLTSLPRTKPTNPSRTQFKQNWTSSFSERANGRCSSFFFLPSSRLLLCLLSLPSFSSFRSLASKFHFQEEEKREINKGKLFSSFLLFYIFSLSLPPLNSFFKAKKDDHYQQPTTRNEKDGLTHQLTSRPPSTQNSRTDTTGSDPHHHHHQHELNSAVGWFLHSNVSHPIPRGLLKLGSSCSSPSILPVVCAFVCVCLPVHFSELAIK